MADKATADMLWFWSLLESANRNLVALSRKLEQLPKEQLRRYQMEYDKWAGDVNPHYWEECHPHLMKSCSEDSSEDFAAWVVMQGLDFYEDVTAHPDRIDDYLRACLRSAVEVG